MADQDTRSMQRKVESGEASAADIARLEADMTRRGQGLVGFLNSLIGILIYVEGIRINYRGVLERVLIHGDGKPAGLVGRWQRVSYFQKEGPRADYTFDHLHEGVIPYETVHWVGRDGFVGCNWPAVPV